jgi:hypothetical protein
MSRICKIHHPNEVLHTIRDSKRLSVSAMSVSLPVL